MKTLTTFALSCALFLLNFTPSFCQSLQITTLSPIITAQTSQTESGTYVYVKNTSALPKKVRVQRVIDYVAPRHITTFCWGGICYDSDKQLSETYTLQPGETTPQAYALAPKIENIYYAPGTSKVTYIFFDDENPNDRTTLQLTYIVSATTDIQPEVDILSTTLSPSFPSPAIDNARISYTIASPYATASLEVYNLIGNVVYTTPLRTARGVVSLSTAGMNSGLYFYSVVVDGKKMATKKLIVKR